jgi:hypothetical protein
VVEVGGGRKVQAGGGTTESMSWEVLITCMCMFDRLMARKSQQVNFFSSSGCQYL